MRLRLRLLNLLLGLLLLVLQLQLRLLGRRLRRRAHDGGQLLHCGLLGGRVAVAAVVVRLVGRLRLQRRPLALWCACCRWVVSEAVVLRVARWTTGLQHQLRLSLSIAH